MVAVVKVDKVWLESCGIDALGPADGEVGLVYDAGPVAVLEYTIFLVYC